MQSIFVKSLKTFIPLTIIILSISSCSTMFGDNTRQITVKSQPAGAIVYMNNYNLGTTPTTITLPNYIYDNQIITVSKPGYASQSVVINNKFQMVGLFNILNLGIGFLIDGATGNFVKIDPNNLNINQNLQKR